WSGAGWGPAWKSAFEGISAAQAAWQPRALDGEELSATHRDRVHSIWQILNHVAFWRETMLDELEGRKPGDEEIARRNWEAPAAGAATETAWEEAKARYARSHERIAQAMATSEENAKRLADLLPHDAYHIGQVHTMRALLGA